MTTLQDFLEGKSLIYKGLNSSVVYVATYKAISGVPCLTIKDENGKFLKQSPMAEWEAENFYNLSNLMID